MKKENLKLFEVYTLGETIPVHAINILDAINTVGERLEAEESGDEVIGVLEIKLFHKGAVQRPDLI